MERGHGELSIPCHKLAQCLGRLREPQGWHLQTGDKTGGGRPRPPSGVSCPGVSPRRSPLSLSLTNCSSSLGLFPISSNTVRTEPGKDVGRGKRTFLCDVVWSTCLPLVPALEDPRTGTRGGLTLDGPVVSGLAVGLNIPPMPQSRSWGGGRSSRFHQKQRYQLSPLFLLPAEDPHHLQKPNYP